jgi:xanthine dehydrogenase small subunit
LLFLQKKLTMPHPLLEFVHAGRIVSLHGVPPTRTLLQVLREDLGQPATKEGCNEGDCGACTVVLGERDGEHIRYSAVNSCIRLAHSIHGMALWTAADLTGPDGTPHPVQQALLHNHASQCGFCTPGFAMSLFGLYQNQVLQGQAVSRAQATQALSGNLCRCTGYRPILDAAQQLDQWPKVSLDEADLLSKLKLLAQSRQALEADFSYKTPTTLAQLLSLRAAQPQAQLVAGCTDVGLWINKAQRDFTQIIDLTQVQELRLIHQDASTLTIGAAVTLTDAFDALLADRSQLHRFVHRFAGLPVRNSGTLGGNIANGSPIGDSMPLLMVLHAQLVLASVRGSRELPLDGFYTGYRQNQMDADELLVQIKVPRPSANEFLRVYKISKRQEDDISAVCLALCLYLQDGKVTRLSIAVGGVAATPIRARQTEAALTGQVWDHTLIELGMTVLRDEFTPISDMRASSAYRTQVLGNLLQRFWLETQGQPDISLDALALPDVCCESAISSNPA